MNLRTRGAYPASPLALEAVKWCWWPQLPPWGAIKEVTEEAERVCSSLIVDELRFRLSGLVCSAQSTLARLSSARVSPFP